MKKFLIVPVILLIAGTGPGIALKLKSDKMVVETTMTEEVSPTKVENCIVTILGKKYNVDQLRKTHPGGDIFKCGEDMTETFTKQHGEDLKRIEKYLVK